ncbi:cytochrome d ubiquinol oxidase subunit II [Pseudonocardia sp. KRD291]|uniref:cytochrome d ubiquinol oxidase subunit II n=1 Tax=Pseudonocardia sp. KRD291 TaxID=2792007 RepID=UPI001C49E52E|nr:cytochrome d ubiquinol oxidase subunit II [Pseudonocardia sp. KRD291]MBW0106379.1 cytochrome d ubiquinol oxidase subunit II [Pseudonocardia sp. KRD291]
MDLPVVWFVAVAVLWTGYLVLEGFDFGVGMLVRVLGRREDDRRVMLGAIGPVWDGNEVWLIAAVGAMFAAFPAWYASMFSGFYLPVLAVLLGLIVRGVALEYREKVEDPRWRARCDAGITAGSFLPAFVWGLVFANLVRGLPMVPGPMGVGVVDAGFTDLVDGYALLGGVLTVALFVLHGAVFLTLKTDGPVRHRARTLAVRMAVPVLVLLAGFLGATLYLRETTWTVWAALASVAALALAAGAVHRGREGWAFTATAATVAGLAVVVFGSLFPQLLVSTTDPALTLDVAGAASAPYTLTVMSWVAVVFLPLVIGYQTWSYWVFRKRLVGERVEPAPEPAGRS